MTKEQDARKIDLQAATIEMLNNTIASKDETIKLLEDTIEVQAETIKRLVENQRVLEALRRAL